MKVKGHELREVRVKRVSLVDRGAIRQPFKIMKRDGAKGDDMNLFKTLFKAAAPAAPAIVALAVSKTADAEAIKARLTAAGFSVDNFVETDDVNLYRQPGAPENIDGGAVIKFDDDVAAVVLNVRKEFCPWAMENPTFGELVRTNGLYPTVRQVLDTMSDAVYGTVNKAASPDEAATEVGKMFDEAKAYAQNYVRDLPSNAFKLDTSVAKGSYKAKEMDMEGEGKKKPVDPEMEDEDEVEKGKGKKKAEGPIDTALNKGDMGKETPMDDEDEMDDEAKKKAKKKSEEGKTEQKSEKSEKSDKADEKKAKSEDGVDIAAVLKDLGSKLELIAGAVAKMDDRLEKMETSQEDIDSRLKKAESANTNLKAAIKAAIPNASGSESRDVPAKKSQQANGFTGGLIDTAMGAA